MGCEREKKRESRKTSRFWLEEHERCVSIIYIGKTIGG